MYGGEVKPMPTQATYATIQDCEWWENKSNVLLWMSVKDIIIPHIREWKTSKETWDTLKKSYETKTANKIFHLKSNLISIKMEENENVSDFNSRIKDKLGDIGETICSGDISVVMPNGKEKQIKNVVYVPQLKMKIIPVSNITKKH